ncbi:MAG: VWA domain-containing protein [Planctomycetes bacterium]|nr:VWA domain-containing protein [Planctomycetota bacterium]
MNFTNPAALILLAAIILIIIAYLLRMPRKRLPIPSAAIVKRLISDHKRVNRNKRVYISFAMQFIIFTCIVLGASGMLFESGSEHNTSVIIILDRSLSMGSQDEIAFADKTSDDYSPAIDGKKSRFENALQDIETQIARVRQDDQCMLLSIGESLDVICNFTNNKASLLEKMKDYKLSGEALTLKPAIELVNSIDQGLENVQILFYTDGAFSAENKQLIEEAENIQVKLFSAKNDNIAITAFRLRPDPSSEDEYQAFTEIRSTFAEDKEIEVQLSLNDSIIDLLNVTVPANGTVHHVFKKKKTLGLNGILTVKLAIDDALMSDNLAYEVLQERPLQRVLLVTAETDPNYFLIRAISSNSSSCEGQVISPDTYKSKIAPIAAKLKGKKDVIIFDRWIPEDASTIPPIHVLGIDCVPPQMPADEKGVFEKPLIRKWSKGHPLMAYLNFRNVFFSKARTIEFKESKETKMTSGSDVEKVAEFVSSPFVLAWEDLNSIDPEAAEGAIGQRFVCLAFNPKESDISLRKELPLLLWNTLSWFSDKSENITQIQPGQSINIDIGDISISELSINCPDGEDIHIAIDAGDDGDDGDDGDQAIQFIPFSNTRSTGVYNYNLPSGEASFVVNSGHLSELSISPSLSMDKSDESDDTESAQASVSYQLWCYLLYLALAVLLFESYSYHRRIYF